MVTLGARILARRTSPKLGAGIGTSRQRRGPPASLRSIALAILHRCVALRILRPDVLGARTNEAVVRVLLEDVRGQPETRLTARAPGPSLSGFLVGLNQFMKERKPARKNEAGRALIRAIFGKDAIAEESLP